MDRRQWVCPWCETGWEIPAGAPDPEKCPKCPVPEEILEADIFLPDKPKRPALPTPLAEQRKMLRQRDTDRKPGQADTRVYFAPVDGIDAMLFRQLMRGRADVAATIFAQHQAGGGLFNFTRAVPSVVLRANAAMDLDYSDLPCPPVIRRAVAAELAIAIITGARLTAERILRRTEGEFACPDLENFIRTRPRGRFTPKSRPGTKRYEKGFSPEKLAVMYGETKVSEAMNLASLGEIVTARVGGGIEINVSNDNSSCDACHAGKLKFGWRELERVPKLPRHWGCRCGYLAWFR